MRLRRIASGEYRTPDGRYRAILRWGEVSGATGRRWTLLRYDESAAAFDVLDTYPTLRAIREELDQKETNR